MQLTTVGKFVLVTIHKPLGVQPDYDFVRVRKEYFTKAKDMGYRVLVRTPNGERVFDPRHMSLYKIVKEVFLIKDNPMKLYELTIPHGEKKDLDAYAFS